MAKEIKDENIVVGKMLQQARESRKVLQSELCDACGLTKNHISAVERGVSQASIKMLLGYCKKLDMSPNEILGFNDDFIDERLKSIFKDMSKEEQLKILEMIKIMKK